MDLLDHIRILLFEFLSWQALINHLNMAYVLDRIGMLQLTTHNLQGFENHFSFK